MFNEISEGDFRWLKLFEAREAAKTERREKKQRARRQAGVGVAVAGAQVEVDEECSDDEDTESEGDNAEEEDTWEEAGDIEAAAEEGSRLPSSSDKRK
jgi:hypothetical protein